MTPLAKRLCTRAQAVSQRASFQTVPPRGFLQNALLQGHKRQPRVLNTKLCLESARFWKSFSFARVQVVTGIFAPNTVQNKTCCPLLITYDSYPKHQWCWLHAIRFKPVLINVVIYSSRVKAKRLDKAEANTAISINITCKRYNKKSNLKAFQSFFLFLTGFKLF